MHKRGLLTLMAALGIVLSGCSGSSGNDLATPANVSTPTVESSPTPALTLEVEEETDQPTPTAESSPTPKLTVEAEEEAPALNCTPGYDPCLPPAYDYDCQGGSGNGPAYTGRVNVTGPDIYGLDRDGDGVGCE
jgi:hypothetical protein